MKKHSLILLAFLAVPSAYAETAPYARQDARAIKALSPERAEGLTSGAGLGYALSAELNGWPGPLHVLELADELDLTSAQREQVAAIRASMLSKARPLGAALVDAEAALDILFAEATPDAAVVSAATAEIGRIEGALRAVHLAAHIETKPVLSRHQRMLYARARGYETFVHEHGSQH